MAEPYTQAEIDDALTALIAYAGNAKGACEFLERENKRTPSPPTLLGWSRTRHWERYEQLRETVAAGREKSLEHAFLDASIRAGDTIMLAIDEAHRRLKEGLDQDPSRTAANLARVQQTSTDKRLALQGRPTRIVENRDVGEILRSLMAKGVIEIPDEPAQLGTGHAS
jgi:hypothetical protein